ncbi:MAG: DedA family protein [Limnobacter sp.]|nr:DedA family protein [Limnobacter sp.]
MWFLGALSLPNRLFSPIPPDVMLAPMAMARPDKWRWLALLTTAASVMGGLLGYFIGAFGFELIESWLASSSWWSAYQTASAWFLQWGVLAVLVAGFSPIPYKVFTIAAGVAGMALLPFFLASCVSRGLRFFLVAGLMAWGGPKMEASLQKYVERLGWGCVVLAVLGVVVYKF